MKISCTHFNVTPRSELFYWNQVFASMIDLFFLVKYTTLFSCKQLQHSSGRVEVHTAILPQLKLWANTSYRIQQLQFILLRCLVLIDANREMSFPLQYSWRKWWGNSMRILLILWITCFRVNFELWQRGTKTQPLYLVWCHWRSNLLPSHGARSFCIVPQSCWLSQITDEKVNNKDCCCYVQHFCLIEGA